MREILFVTTNHGKVESLARCFPQGQYHIVEYPMELPEIQGHKAIEVATEKARTAYELIGKPLIIQDSAFHINALNGFPGPYIKYIQQSIGEQGILTLMNGVADRSCYFEQALVYIDETGMKSFVSGHKVGTIAHRVADTHSKRSWGSVWNIFIPQGQSKTLSEMSDEELRTIDSTNQSVGEFTQFSKWLQAKTH